MASDLSSLSVWDYLHVKTNGRFRLNDGGSVVVDYDSDPTTGATSVKFGSAVVERFTASTHRFLNESTLGSELVSNGNCETFTSGLVTGWTEWDTGGVLTPAEEAVDVYAGSKAQKLTRTAGATYAAVTSNTITMTRGKWYVVSFALKALAGTPRVLVNNTGSTVTLHNFGNLTPAAWTAYAAVFYCTETRTDYCVRFDSSSFATFTVLLDAVSVKEVTAGSVGIGDDLTVGGAASIAEALNCEATITGRTGVTAGVDGVARGRVRATRGTGSNQPGVLELQALDGTVYYCWRTAAGRWRRHTTLPTADTDGTDAIDILDSLAVGGSGAITGNLTVGGNATVTGDVSGANADFGGTLNADGAATLGSTLDVTGAVSGASVDATGNVTAGGTVDAVGNVSSDADVVAGGNVAAVGGQVLAGDYGAARGVVVANHGADSNKPGYHVLYSANGTATYLWTTANNTVRVHTSVPTSDSDGVEIARILRDGVIELGVSGTTRGYAVAHNGGGGNTPGYYKLYSPNGTAFYLFCSDLGTLRVHTSAPASNSDGTVVGNQMT